MTEKLEAEINSVLDSNVLIKNMDEKEEMEAITQSLIISIDRNNSINMVKEFMETFNQTIGKTISFPDDKTLELRCSLMLEELIEFAEACGPNIYGIMQRILFKRSQEIHYDMESKRETLKPDLVKALDALGDQRYVNDGTILALGLDKVFDEAFLEIHNSNMSKACNTMEESFETIEKYKSEGVVANGAIINDKILVLRTLDKKVLKSINYKPALLDKFIYKSI